MAPSSSTPNRVAKQKSASHVSDDTSAIAFGKYRVFPRRRQLFAAQRVVELGGRAFEVLLALLEAEGRLVTKEELLRRVWPNTVVDEHNISVHISTIRRALGKDRDLIVTDSGRGYRFTGTILPVASGRTLEPTQGPIQTNISAPLSTLVGREKALTELSESLWAHRLVTLAGAGGIGKTRLALEVARLVLPSFPNGAWIAELAPLVDPKLAAGTIASALGVNLGANGDLVDCLKALSSDAILLVIDNCEHVIEVVAHLAEMMLRCVPSLRILATSRESLGADGEYVYQVSPLEVPPESFIDTDQIVRFSAVQLFAKRVRATDAGFLLNDDTAATVGTICRRLDGIPLAIELAAARVETLGLVEVSRRLGDRFNLLTSGRRTALARHRTLRATLEWSYRLLGEAEQATLRRLAVFTNGFTLASAGAVIGGENVSQIGVADLVTGLVRKSLVTADMQRMTPRYRLLETTRAYALEELANSGEARPIARRHAVYFRGLLEGVQADWAAVPAPELLARYAPEIDNIRAALDWSFSSDGDVQTGIALAAASIPLWTLLSLLAECHESAMRALTHMNESASSTRYGMLLQAALGMSLMWAKGPVSATREAWERSLKIARELGDAEYQVRALYGIWIFHLRIGGHRRALSFARQLRKVAERAGDLSSILTGNRIFGVSLHYLGQQMLARTTIQGVIESQEATRNLHRCFILRFGLDQRVAAWACQARVHWVQGFPDLAWRMALAGVKEAEVLGHANSLCIALAEGACPVAILRGDVAAADRFATTLIEEAERHGLGLMRAAGLGLRGWVLINRGEVERGYDLMRSIPFGLLQEGSAELAHANVLTMGVIIYGALADIACRSIWIGDPRPVIAGALRLSQEHGGRWCTAELLRIDAELMLATSVPGAREIAEKKLIESLTTARNEGARSWELRAAISLGRLYCAGNLISEARSILAQVYSSFDEGFDTADLQAAKALLKRLN
jgi:predicted ATPase/DNA-binding winged helix-turn-helix (wHTH) protein